MRKMLTVGITFILLVTYGEIALGQTYEMGEKGNMACKKANPVKQKDYACGQCEEPLIEEFDQLLDDIEKNSSKYTKIEDVMAKFPEQLRTDVVFMGDSRSLQAGDRYLMKSPASEIVASFNGHPELRGGNNVEVMKFNGKTGTFDFIDIKFEDGKPIVTKNPRKCARCHGGPEQARPIFDPYRFWSQQIPSVGDTLVKGTKEAEDFMKFLDKIENKDNKPEWKRFEHLKPFLKMNSKRAIEAGLNYNGYWHVKTQPQPPGSTSTSADGPGVRLFDEMYLNNHCRINRLLAKDEDFETIKYALAAAAMGCFRSQEQLAKALPPSIMRKSDEYFIKRGIGKKGIYNNVYGDVFKDTEKKQDEYFKDRVGRKLWMLEERFRKDEPGISEEEAYQKAKAELIATNLGAMKNPNGSNQISDREQSSFLVAPFRYILEPIGFDTSNLSISFDPGSYTFGDFIKNMANFEPLLSLVQNNSCVDLENKSMQSYGAKEAKVISDIQLACNKLEPWDKQFDDLAAIDEKINKDTVLAKRLSLRADMNDMLDSCSGCHREGSTVGAPNLPFGDGRMDQFDALMEKTAGEMGDMRKRIWSRINRSESAHGLMPPWGLDDEEKKTVKDYLETFQGKMRDDKDKARVIRGRLQNN